MANAVIKVCESKDASWNKMFSDKEQTLFPSKFETQMRKFPERVVLENKGYEGAGSTFSCKLDKGNYLGNIIFEAEFPALRHKNEPMQIPPINKADTPAECKQKLVNAGVEESSSYIEEESSSSSASSDDFAVYNTELLYIFLKHATIKFNQQSKWTDKGERHAILDRVKGNVGKNDRAVGRYPSIEAQRKLSRRVQKLRLALDTWFKDGKRHLPLLYLRGDKKPTVSLEIATEDLQRLYQTSDQTVPYLLHSDKALEPKDIKVKVTAEIFYVSKENSERLLSKSALLPEPIMMRQPHYFWKKVDSKTTRGRKEVSFTLQSDGPILDVMWYVISDEHVNAKCYFNTEGIADVDGGVIDYMCPIMNTTINIDDEVTEKEIDGSFFSGWTVDNEFGHANRGNSIFYHSWNHADSNSMSGSIPPNTPVTFTHVLDPHLGDCTIYGVFHTSEVASFSPKGASFFRKTSSTPDNSIKQK